jgi:hypothetical protein
VRSTVISLRCRSFQFYLIKKKLILLILIRKTCTVCPSGPWHKFNPTHSSSYNSVHILQFSMARRSHPDENTPLVLINLSRPPKKRVRRVAQPVTHEYFSNPRFNSKRSRRPMNARQELEMEILLSLRAQQTRHGHNSQSTRRFARNSRSETSTTHHYNAR